MEVKNEKTISLRRAGSFKDVLFIIFCILIGLYLFLKPYAPGAQIFSLLFFAVALINLFYFWFYEKDKPLQLGENYIVFNGTKIMDSEVEDISINEKKVRIKRDKYPLLVRARFGTFKINLLRYVVEDVEDLKNSIISILTKIKDFRNKEDFGGYEYYNLRGKPVRIVLSETDLYPMGADVLDDESGFLVRAATYMSKVETDPYCDEITKKEFYVLCKKNILNYQKNGK